MCAIPFPFQSQVLIPNTLNSLSIIGLHHPFQFHTYIFSYISPIHQHNQDLECLALSPTSAPFTTLNSTHGVRNFIFLNFFNFYIFDFVSTCIIMYLWYWNIDVKVMSMWEREGRRDGIRHRSKCRLLKRCIGAVHERRLRNKSSRLQPSWEDLETFKARTCFIGFKTTKQETDRRNVVSLDSYLPLNNQVYICFTYSYINVPYYIINITH